MSRLIRPYYVEDDVDDGYQEFFEALEQFDLVEYNKPIVFFDDRTYPMQHHSHLGDNLAPNF